MSSEGRARPLAWRDWSCSTRWSPGCCSSCTRWLGSGEWPRYMRSRCTCCSLCSPSCSFWRLRSPSSSSAAEATNGEHTPGKGERGVLGYCPLRCSQVTQETFSPKPTDPLSIRIPFVLACGLEGARYACASLGHAGVALPQGNTGKARVTFTRHPVAGLATWKIRGEKGGSACLLCIKCSKSGSLGARGCQCALLSAFGVCGCARLLCVRAGVDALCWTSGTLARTCVHGAAMKGEKTRPTFQPLLFLHQQGTSFKCLGLDAWELGTVQPILFQMCCHVSGGQAAGGSDLISTCMNYRLSTMLPFLPERLEWQEKKRKRFSCHLQRAPTSITPLADFIPKLLQDRSLPVLIFKNNEAVFSHVSIVKKKTT